MQSYEMLQLDQIEVTNLNPRKSFEIEPMEELKASIREHGILEPLIVRATSTEDKYELVAGERRFRAATDLQLQEVPCIIRVMDDDTMRELMLLENLQRQDLEPIETAEALQEILKSGKHTQEEIARKVGRSQPWIANQLRLLKAPPEVRGLLIRRQITPKHIHLMLPYVDYPKVLKALSDALLTGNYHKSTDEWGRFIENTVTGYHHSELGILDIDRLSDHYELRSYFDKTDCKMCGHAHQSREYRNQEMRYCLCEVCWSLKLKDAELKHQEATQRLIAQAAKSQKLSVEKLDQTVGYRGYERLKYKTFDKGDCEKCDKCRKTTSGDIVCLDPSCVKRKERSETIAKNKEIRANWSKVKDEVDRYIDTDFKALSPKVLKELIYTAAINWRPSSQKALRPWGPVDRIDELSGTTRKISEKDAPQALARLYIYHAMEAKGKSDVESAKAICKEVSS